MAQGTTSLRQLTWFDRSGRTLGPLGEPDRSGQINVNLSRDGRRAAVQHLQKDQGVWDHRFGQDLPVYVQRGW